jgi:hypothetical protein
MVSGQQQAARLDSLMTTDFTDPRHRNLFTAIRQLTSTQKTVATDWQAAITEAAGSGVTREDINDLTHACPDPAHGAAYAAILIEATAYRLARARAHQIDAQGAPPGHLAEVAKAIHGHTALLRPGPPGAVPQLSPAADESQPGLTTDGSPATLAQQREELVLSALLQNHSQAGQLLAFLPAAAFTSPGRQELFRAIRRLAHSHRPVDELTVSWELATHAATAAVLSPHAAPELHPSSAYVRSLASAGPAATSSPLGAARDLDAELRYRSSRDHRGPKAISAGLVRLQKPAAPASLTLIKPTTEVHRPMGPEHDR